MNALLYLDREAPPRRMVWDQPVSDDQLEALCAANDVFQLERTREGEIVTNPPTMGNTSDGNAEIVLQLRLWWKTHRRGKVYESNCGFFLPDGSMLAPDAAYVLPEKLRNLGAREKAKMFRFCPDFVIELLSRSDNMDRAQAKMRNWIANGAALGWLIDPYERRVFKYVAGVRTGTVTGDSVQGSGPVEGFILDLAEVWSCYE
jgi:Uma2 family endonuclease